MENLRQIKIVGKSRYEEIINYLKLDEGYWIEKDVWNINDNVFQSNLLQEEYKVGVKEIRIDFIKSVIMKNEVKYYLIYSLKNKYFTLSKLLNEEQYAIRYLIEFMNIHMRGIDSFKDININAVKWKLFLIRKGLKLNTRGEISNTTYRYEYSALSCFIINFYDDREETEKNIWYSKNIVGARIPASGYNNQLNFNSIPTYYRETVKMYFRTVVTKKSWAHCSQILNYLKYFFRVFYENGYTNGFLENLSRKDIEKYIYWMLNDHKDDNATYRCKFVSYIRIFLEYIQMAQYKQAPNKEIAYLIFQDDIPKRELNKDEVKKARFIPEPVIKQLDSNIMDLDRPQYIPIYILLRETGWRGTDILNLRYDNCLEQIWNGKEQQYNFYLCGEITKTGIAQLKIPVREEVSEMIQTAIDKVKEVSTNENNPKRYLFNIYEGRFKGKPFSKNILVSTIQRLIREKDIRNINGELYHFRTHSLRHTRAKEYVEQGMGISIVQQILGHQSLQMTVHYATVTENTLYEKWKTTEDLELFKINIEDKETGKTNLSQIKGETFIRYEYIKKNLDAVRVPFGICFKSSKISCKQQINHCFACASFCTTEANIGEYEDEIARVKKQIEISVQCNRELWADKNKQYLGLLETMMQKVKKQKIIHKNDSSREES